MITMTVDTYDHPLQPAHNINISNVSFRIYHQLHSIQFVHSEIYSFGNTNETATEVIIISRTNAIHRRYGPEPQKGYQIP